MQFRRAHHFTSLLMAALLAIGASAASRADVLDGVLEVSSAYVKLNRACSSSLRGSPIQSTTTFARPSRTASC